MRRGRRLREKVNDILKNKLNLVDVDMQRAHRVGKRDKENKRPRTIVAYLLRYTDKDLIYKNGKKLKGSGIYINDGFCKATMLMRRNLKDKLKELSERNIKAKMVYNKIVYIKDNE